MAENPTAKCILCGERKLDGAILGDDACLPHTCFGCSKENGGKGPGGSLRIAGTPHIKSKRSRTLIEPVQEDVLGDLFGRLALVEGARRN